MNEPVKASELPRPREDMFARNKRLLAAETARHEMELGARIAAITRIDPSWVTYRKWKGQ